MNTNTIIGYRVQDHNGMFVEFNGVENVRVYAEPAPISHADAYRRLAAFIESNPQDVAEWGVPRVIPVYYKPTPVECASAELGGLLQNLCARHGLELGLSRDQINAQIAKELQALQAGESPSIAFIAGGVPRVR
ncbi:MAG: hypothetical protein ACRETL_14615 [Gammaproteobacteria bacterium]